MQTYGGGHAPKFPPSCERTQKMSGRNGRFARLPVLASTTPRGRPMDTRPHDLLPPTTAAGNGCRLRGFLEAGKMESVSESTPAEQSRRLLRYAAMRKLVLQSSTPPHPCIAQWYHTACTALLPPFTLSSHAPYSRAVPTGTQGQAVLV